jgi:serine phosphatase RsbU (regulator of sigma subunit)
MADSNVQLEALQRENMQLRRAVDELSVLNELSAAIGASRGMEDLIQTIIRRSIKAIRAEQGVITLVGSEATDPTKTLVRTMASSSDREAYSPDQNLLGWMHLNRRPLVINDPPNDSRFQGVSWPAAVRSILVVPMLVHSRLTGILTLYNKKRGEGFSTEDQRLLSILAGQSAQVVENARLAEEEKKLAVMQQELNFAYEIQTNLLPGKAPPIDHYDLAGISIPAQSVGGDYFDYIPVDAGKIAICVADVSGKGLPAALMMSNLQATLRGQAQFSVSVHETVERSNHLLTQSVRRGTFVTLFYGVLDPSTHSFVYANAGHNRPYIVRAEGKLETLTLGGLVLGFLGTQKYRQAETNIGVGDLLFIFSDGVTEAMNANKEQFEEARLEELLLTLRDAPAEQVITAVGEAVHKHAAGFPQNDDITMLAVKRVK